MTEPSMSIEEALTIQRDEARTTAINLEKQRKALDRMCESVQAELAAAEVLLAATQTEREKAVEQATAYATALQKVSDIRDGIVGMQGFHWSEHAYPLVAVLDAAGFEGKGYEISRVNLGTLLEQRDALAKRVEELEAEAAEDAPLVEKRAEARLADAARIASLQAELTAIRANGESAMKCVEAARSACRSVIQGFSAMPAVSLSGAIDHLDDTLRLLKETP